MEIPPLPLDLTVLHLSQSLYLSLLLEVQHKSGTKLCFKQLTESLESEFLLVKVVYALTKMLKSWKMCDLTFSKTGIPLLHPTPLFRILAMSWM